ncbi:hypothetical protein [Okeania sp. SIO2C2]|nr:hypothetical protein [Okeania sp. SIO2C2]
MLTVNSTSYLGFALKSLMGEGRRQETGEMGTSEEIGVISCSDKH